MVRGKHQLTSATKSANRVSSRWQKSSTKKPPKGGSQFKPDDRVSGSNQCWL
jgi:hypothetical protein